jgi:glycosyltransferase involved in cell wall biosynthesis
VTVPVLDVLGPARGRAALTGDAPLRVVSISHSAVRAGAARMRYEALAGDPQLDLTLVVPEVWHEYGQAERAEPSRTRLRVRVEAARLTRGGPAKWYLHHYPRLRGLLRALRPDVIHLWEEPWSLVALQAARLRDSVAPGAALLLETDQNILRRLPPGFEQIRRYTLARTDLLVARCEEALAVSRACGFGGAAEFVEYGINETVFFPRDRAAARAAHGVDPDAAPGAGRPLRLGYVGRLVPEKGLDDVLAALHRCPAPVALALLGDGPEKAGLLARAAALGLADRVQAYAPRPPSGVAEFIASLDALVLMSRTTRTWKEQFGRVIMEAHACGVPVIGSSSGSIPSVVGRGGWIVPEGDTPALAALLARLAASPDEVALAGEVGRREAERRFGGATIAADLKRAWVRAAAIRQEGQADTVHHGARP